MNTKIKVSLRGILLLFISIISILNSIASGNTKVFQTDFYQQKTLIESTYSQINISDQEKQPIKKQMLSLLDSVKFYNTSNPSKSNAFANSIIQTSEKYGFDPIKLEALNVMGWNYIKKDCLDSSQIYFEKALELSEYLKDTLSIAKAFRGISEFYVQSNRLLIANEYLKKIYELRDGIQDKEFLGLTMYALGNRNKNLGNYNDALKYFMACLKYREEVSSDVRIASALISIGNIYRHIDDYDNAFSYARKAHDLCVKSGCKLTRVHNQYGLIYLNLNENEKALEYFRLAFKQDLEDDDKVGMGRGLNNIGITLRRLGRKEDALNYQFEALALKKETNDILYIGSTYSNISEVYLELGQYSKAKKYLDSAFSYNHRFHLKDRIMSNYDGYYQLYNTLGDYKKALDYYILYAQMKDTIYSSEEQRKISELSALFELEKKENENLVLVKDNQIKKFEIEKQTDLRNLFIAISILVVLLIIIVIYRYYLKSKMNDSLSKSNALITFQREKLKEINVTKDKFFSIIAHDLKSPFNAILGFGDILQNEYNELSEEDRKKIIHQLVKSSKNTLGLLENLLTWAKSQKGQIQMQPDFHILNTLVEQAISSYYGTATIKGIIIKNKVNGDYRVYVDEPTIKIVIGNIVNNAIKFSYSGGKIELITKQFEQTTELRIKDVGVGMGANTVDNLFKIEESHSTLGTKNEKGTGLGLIISKEFVEQNGGMIKVESEVDKGSVFIISLPNKPIEKA